MIRRNFLRIILLTVFGASMSLGETWALKVVVKRPYLTVHYDSLGNLVLDSLVRNRKLATIIYKTGLVDSLFSETVTNDSGFAIFNFDHWHDETMVDSSSLERIDISFPNTYKPVKTGEQVFFEPLRFNAVQFKRQTPEVITIVLPLNIHLTEYSIGAGYFEFVV